MAKAAARNSNRNSTARNDDRPRSGPGDTATPDARGPAQDWFNRTLPRTLLHAYTWVDDGLQNYMMAHAAFSLPRAQSMLMVCIGDGIQRQSEMAKVLKVSKQAVRQGIRELVQKGLVEVVADPDNQRSRQVRFTEEGRSIRETARRGIFEVEKRLEERIGSDRVRLLNELLQTQWGPAPRFPEEADR